MSRVRDVLDSTHTHTHTHVVTHTDASYELLRDGGGGWVHISVQPSQTRRSISVIMNSLTVCRWDQKQHRSGYER